MIFFLSAGRKTSATQAHFGLPGTHTFAYFYDGDGDLETHIRTDGSAVVCAFRIIVVPSGNAVFTAPDCIAFRQNGDVPLYDDWKKNPAALLKGGGFGYHVWKRVSEGQRSGCGDLEG